MQGCSRSWCPNGINDEQDTRTGGKSFSKTDGKESMAVITAPVKISTKPNKKEAEKGDSAQGKWGKKLTLQEMQNKEYPFPNTEVPKMLEQLLELKIIELQEMKRPEEAGRVHDPNYCKYHRLVSHSTQGCFVRKEIIVELASEGKMSLEEEK